MAHLTNEPSAFFHESPPQQPPNIYFGAPRSGAAPARNSTSHQESRDDEYARVSTSRSRYSGDNPHSVAGISDTRTPTPGPLRRPLNDTASPEEQSHHSTSSRNTCEPDPFAPGGYVPVNSRSDVMDSHPGDVLSDENRNHHPLVEAEHRVTLPPNTSSRYLNDTAHDFQPYVPKSLHGTGRHAINTVKTLEQSVRSQMPRLSSKLSSTYTGVSESIDGEASRLEHLFSGKTRSSNQHHHHQSHSDTRPDLVLVNANSNANIASTDENPFPSMESVSSIAGGDADTDDGGVLGACASCLSGVGSVIGCIADILE